MSIWPNADGGARTAVFDRWSDGHCPTEARANWSDRFVRPVPAGPVQPVQELIGQACPTRRQVLRSDSACPTTGRTRLFEHRSNCRVRPVNAGSEESNKLTEITLLQTNLISKYSTAIIQLLEEIRPSSEPYKGDKSNEPPHMLVA
ncbi:hypothetical protein PCASD_22494 [Puccinia coronata f. sp. avenae]|uniref:Uncharacterized protein n=1 Tax=Puccinia coronata f. sp. avenae TaxID=200324 RepID=A0A2N5TRI3_9BASI|nr:hypothetical protein PCASD_22494 [Puccinia coronata f. sp. avenae]